MTELQFLIDLLLNHKLPRATKTLIAERIGQVEGRHTPQAVALPMRHPSTLQAPSMQAIIDGTPNVPLVAATPVPPQLAPASRRIVGGEVSTGNGTKGPRKF